MNKTTQRLLLVFSTLLLLVSVTASTHAQAPDFNGTWSMVTDKGKTLFFRLEQGHRGVTGSYPVNGLTGSYQPSDGSNYGIVKVSASTAQPAPQNLGFIRGSVKDNVLRFTWRQDNGRLKARLARPITPMRLRAAPWPARACIRSLELGVESWESRTWSWYSSKAVIG